MAVEDDVVAFVKAYGEAQRRAALAEHMAAHTCTLLAPKEGTPGPTGGGG